MVQVRVVPNCPVPSIEEFNGGLKVRVKAKPVGGKANAEVIAAVAAHYGVKPSAVSIARGASSNKKTVCVKN